MGFCTDDQAQHFLNAVPLVEKAIVESGVLLLKYWLEVSPEEQTRRLEGRINDGRKIWKLSPMDLKSYKPVVRLLPGARCDVRGDGHRLGAVERRAVGRQEEGAAECDFALAQPSAVRGSASPEDRVTQAAEGG